MSSETRIDRLDDSGKLLFVYSDKYNIYFIFHDRNEKLYLITTDKYLDIESADQIDVPENFFKYNFVKFFKPYSNTSDHTFIGIVKIDGKSFKFSISNLALTLTEEVDYVDNCQFNILTCLKDLTVTAYIQKKNKVFLVGYYEYDKVNEYIYGVVNIETDTFEQIYYIYSDKGDLILSSVNIDIDGLKVYVVGHIDHIVNDQIVDSKPFVEEFLLRK